MESDRQFDVFICHASEDKDSLVRPLAAALAAAGLRVWYDETSLSLGSNLRRSIDVGLSKARYGLVVISQAFFSKQWPQWELDGLHQRHLAEGNVLLPIWHEVSADSVRRVSPSLANLVAVSTSEGLGVVIEKILDTVKPVGESGRQGTAMRDSVESGSSTLTTSDTSVVAVPKAFDAACADFERLIDNRDDASMRELIFRHPQLASSVLRAYPAIARRNVPMGRGIACDIVAMCAPQWIEASMLKLGPVSQPPFNRDGSWSSGLADAVGSILSCRSWTSRNSSQFSKILEDMVQCSSVNWPFRSGYQSTARMLAAAGGAAHRVTTIILFGRHRMMDEEARHLLHRSLPDMDLRSYDSILWNLYSRCPRIVLANPIILKSTSISDGDSGSLILGHFPSDLINAAVRSEFDRSAPELATLRVISFDLGAWITVDGATRDLERPPGTVPGSPGEMPIGLNVQNQDSVWGRDRWTSAHFWSEAIVPTGFSDQLSLRYRVTRVDKGTSLHIGIYAIRYRYHCCELNEGRW